MDKELINYYQEELLEQKDRLEKELQQFAKKSEDIADDYDSRFPDYGDQEDENAKEVAAFGDRLSLEADFEYKLQNINRALEKIEEGTYGICDNCGEKIPEERLKAYPAAVLCVKCHTGK